MVVGPHTSRDFVVIREERNGDLVLSLKKLELQVGGPAPVAGVLGAHCSWSCGQEVRALRASPASLCLCRGAQVAWQRLRQCLDDDVAVEGEVVGTNRGGIIVEVSCSSSSSLVPIRRWQQHSAVQPPVVSDRCWPAGRWAVGSGSS